jgi:2-keto-4-pentenoate hydratase
MHVHEPIGGWLTDRMALVHDDLCRGLARAAQGEPEIAFGLPVGLAGADVTGADVLRATDWVAPATEVLDPATATTGSRCRTWSRTRRRRAVSSSGRRSPRDGLPLDLVGVVFEADGKLGPLRPVPPSPATPPMPSMVGPQDRCRGPADDAGVVSASSAP